MTANLVILVFLQATQPQLAIENELRRQTQEIQTLRTEVRRELEQVRELLNRQARPEADLPKPVCSAELRWIGNSLDRSVPGSASATAPLSLLSTVSRPAGCLSADLRVTASYLDAAGNLICSGSIENVAIQTAHIQTLNLLIKPWNLPEFVRWTNEPSPRNSGAKRLVCINPEGTAESTDRELAAVSEVRISVTALPAGGGMSTIERKISLPR